MKNIKHKILDLIPQKYLPPIEDGSSAVNAHQCVRIHTPDSTKSWRGWGNPITARLLCPIDYIDHFNESQDEYANMSSLWSFTNNLLL